MVTASPPPEAATRKHGRLPDLRAMLHFYLHLIGFTASTLLLTWGLFTLLFLALGGFSLDGLMHQLNNLTSRSEEHTSELQSLMRISYAVFCLKKKNSKTCKNR